jgi:hypothetical protein
MLLVQLKVDKNKTYEPHKILKEKILPWNDMRSDQMKMKQEITLLLMGVNKLMYVVEDTCMFALWLIIVKFEFRSEVIGWKWSNEVTSYL